MCRRWRQVVRFSLSLILLFGSGSFSHALVNDTQDEETINKLNDLKKLDAQEVYKSEANLARFPLFVFVPGILGSKIEECDKQNNVLVNCVSIWGQKNWADALSVTDMSIKSTKSYRTSVLDNFEVLGQQKDFYGDGLAFIQSVKISDQASLVPFSYDWRQDNRISALQLHRRLCDLSPAEKARPIIFVAHSMGGLILKYWLARLYPQQCPDKKNLNLRIQEVMFLGTPHYGAPAAVEAFAEGFKLEEGDSGVFGMVKNLYSRDIVALALNRYGTMFPSVYQLLPIYGDSCMSSVRKEINLPDPVSTNSGGIFDLFSSYAWKQAGWPVCRRASIRSRLKATLLGNRDLSSAWV
jgi:hypothetical protein